MFLQLYRMNYETFLLMPFIGLDPSKQIYVNLEHKKRTEVQHKLRVHLTLQDYAF